MLGGMDPRTMKNMMAKMGISSTDIEAIRVTIECGDKEIIIVEPQVILIEAQGTKSFQIAGSISERKKETPPDVVEITDDDITMVMENSGESDRGKVRGALKATNGDIAAAIMKLKQNK